MQHLLEKQEIVQVHKDERKLYMNIALILSGGSGTRVGSSIPKQYIEVAGKPIITYCVKTLSAHEAVDFLWIVAEKEWQDKIIFWLKQFGLGNKVRGFSLPGENRQLSILNALEDIAQFARKEDYVLIHDAARPCLSEQMITDCFKAIEGHDGVLPVLPMKDTVYLSEDGKRITSLLDRSRIFAGQAPEVFILGKYLDANRRLFTEEYEMADGTRQKTILVVNGSTEPAVLAGMDVVMILGEEGNFKVTTKGDLERFRRLMEG